MPSRILGPVERAVAAELLRLSEIYDTYQVKASIWVRFFQNIKVATNTLTDENGNLVEYRPYQLVRDSLSYLIPTAEELLNRIRRLKDSETFEFSDLYSRLDRLEIGRVSEADHKGLFLLAAKAAEDGEVFHE